jgi:hypothetical protein
MGNESVRRRACHKAKLFLVPPRNYDDQSLDDALLDIAAVGRKKYVNPCVLLGTPAYPASRDACAHPLQDQEVEAVPATILVPGESSDDGDWPF